MRRIDPSFFEQDPLTCARDLIGSVLVWYGCHGRIVETEAYAAVDDPACHTWSRPSSRAFVAHHEAGVAYVYLNYGIHWLFNVLVKGEHGAGFVLLRALEPVAGVAAMRARRGPMKDAMLAAGPGRLTRALGIDGSVHGARFLDSEACTILQGCPSGPLQAGPRIGISKATERLWRFGDPASPSLSQKFPTASAAN